MPLSAVHYFALISLVFLPSVASYNILIALPIESESIHHFYSKLSKYLVEANHSVTLITSYNASFSHPNFRHVYMLAGESQAEHNLFDNMDIIDMFLKTEPYLINMATAMWSNHEVLDLWEKRNTFDAFIMAAFMNEIAMPFLMNYTGELILISNPGLEYFSIVHFGNWLPPSVVPLIVLPFDEKMSFFERVINVMLFPAFYYGHHWFNVQGAQRFLKSQFPELEDVENYYSRVSLTLINGVSALDGAVPLLPNQVEIGTLNSHPAQPLPKDLKDFMASSGDHGVIYFSLGSIAKSTDIPTRAKLEVIEAFRRLPQKVIWKYETDDLDVPPNVMIRSWVPQQDILGHPKTRVFVTQGGVMSIQELHYHGVPALLLPIIFDQHRNSARLDRKKLGIQLDWDTVTADQIVESINILVNDSSYSLRLKTLSEVLRDQKESPAERAVWWIEYVIRHQGAPHLQYPGKRLYFLQYICADVFFFLAVSFYLVYRIMKKLTIVLFGYFCRKGAKPKQKRS